MHPQQIGDGRAARADLRISTVCVSLNFDFRVTAPCRSSLLRNRPPFREAYGGICTAAGNRSVSHRSRLHGLQERELEFPGFSGHSCVGPANIESAELVWKGVAYRGNREFLEACCALSPASGAPFDSDVVPGYVMRAGAQSQFIGFDKSADPAVFAALQKAVISRYLQLNVCYCSIFDECWQGDLTRLNLKPKQVEACTSPAVPFDQGISNGKQ